MNKELIDKMVLLALAEAERQKIAITISIVDQSGRLQFLYRQPECSYFAIDASRKKAITSSQLKIPSHIVGEIGLKFPALKSSLDLNPEIESLPGGCPVKVNGSVIGGIGIAGGNFEQDKSNKPPEG